MSLKHSACHAFRAIKKTCLSMGTGSAFQFKKLHANVETRRGNKETVQSMCKAPPPPTSPPTQVTAFANIAKHLFDKHKKNKKITETTLKLSRILKICSETIQKPCRSSPKRPNKPRTRQTSQKLPPKLGKFAKSLPKKAPRLPKWFKKTPKSSQKAP